MSREHQSGGAWPHDTKRSGSGHTPKWGGNVKLVSYCPECPTNVNFPDQSPKAIVKPGQKKANCRNGHHWEVKG